MLSEVLKKCKAMDRAIMKVLEPIFTSHGYEAGSYIIRSFQLVQVVG